MIIIKIYKIILITVLSLSSHNKILWFCGSVGQLCVSLRKFPCIREGSTEFLNFKISYLLFLYHSLPCFNNHPLKQKNKRKGEFTTTNTLAKSNIIPQHSVPIVSYQKRRKYIFLALV